MKTLTKIMNFLSGVSDTINRGLYPMIGLILDRQGNASKSRVDVGINHNTENQKD